MINSNKKNYTQINANTYRFNNQFFYGEKVHTYLINLKKKVLLFDIPSYSKKNKKFILSFNKKIYCILSHGSCGIQDGTKWQEQIGMKVYLHNKDRNHPWLRMEPDVLFNNLPNLSPNLIIIHTPGHSLGSVCLLDKYNRLLFSGDTIYGTVEGEIKDFTVENSNYYEDLEERIKSCNLLLKYDFEKIYPFHHYLIEENGKNKLIRFLKALKS